MTTVNTGDAGDTTVKGLVSFQDILIKRLSATDDDVRLSSDYIHPNSSPISNWADAYRKLHGGSAFGDNYDTRRTPYMYGIYEALQDRTGRAESVIICKAAQIGVTEGMINFVGYAIDKWKCTIIYCMGTDAKAKTFGKNSFAPMFADPPLRNILRDHLEKGNRRAAYNVSYPGGHIEIVGGQSPNVFRSTAAGIVIIDEYSAMPISLKNEGSAYDLAKTRTKTFGSRGKVVCCSTPTIDSTEKGSLMKLVDEGDRRQFYMPCPHCANMDYFNHEHFAWGKDDAGEYTAWMNCQNKKCGKPIYEYHKPDMMMKGEWRATKERSENDRVSFMVSGFLNAAPNAWAALARKWQSIKDDESDLTAFFNHDIGIPYSPQTTEPDYSDLRHHCIRQYTRGVVPADVKFLTASFDPHKDNIRWEIKGHGGNLTTYSVETGRISIGIDDAGVHEAVRGIMTARYPTADGYTLPIVVGAMDSGYHTNTVYDLCSYYRQPQVVTGKGKVLRAGTLLATKGSNETFPTQIIEGSKRVIIPLRNVGQSEMRVWRVGTQIPKRQLYLKLGEGGLDDDAGDGVIKELVAGDTARAAHYFPEDYDKATFAELVAEKWRREHDKRTGRLKDVFFRPKNARNEALDLHVLNVFCGAFIVSSDRNDKSGDRLYAKLRKPLDMKGDPSPTRMTLAERRREATAKRKRKRENHGVSDTV